MWHDIYNTDIVIIQRPNSTASLGIMADAKRMGKAVIIDFDDIKNLRDGSDALFNSHIAMLERINAIQRESDKFSCIPTGESMLMYFRCVKCVERIMWKYLNVQERELLNKIRPKPFSSMGKDPMTGKNGNGYNYRTVEEIENWEVEINGMIAQRGLALKSGKDPSKAIFDN